jgi:formiminoglutamase
MANLAVGRAVQLCDLGDVTVDAQNLEPAQAQYARRASQVIEAGNLVIGLGGGHEIAFASSSALRAAKPDAKIGILYFDAHFDVRQGAERTSGTPFRDILTADSNVSAFAIGINPAANTQKLFQTAGELGVEHWLDTDVPSAHPEQLRYWLESIEALYITFDLDVLPAAEAPGVSAPAAYGVPYRSLRPLLRMAVETGKLKIFDIAELNPRLDIDDRTAKIAARIIWDVVEWLP